MKRTDPPFTASIDWPRSRPDRGGDVLVCAINLDRSPDRWDALSDQLDRSGLPYLRLSAFDGQSLDPALLEESVDRRHFENANGREPTPGDIGCYLSHVAAWTALASRSETFLVVVEDDAVFESGWVETLREAVQAYRPGTMMKLSWQRRGFYREVRRIDGAHRLVQPLTHQACNAAYLLDRKAAERLIEAALPLYLPVDHYVEAPWVTGVTVQTVFPALARQRGMRSTIGKVRKFHWSRRVPTLFYRIKAHSLRLACNLF